MKCHINQSNFPKQTLRRIFLNCIFHFPLRELRKAVVVAWMSLRLVTSSMVAGMTHSYLLEILRMVPRRIFPLLVLGNLSTKMTPMRRAKAPTSVLTLS